MSTGGLNYAVGSLFLIHEAYFASLRIHLAKQELRCDGVCHIACSSECPSVPHYIESSLVLGEGSNSEPVGFSLFRKHTGFDMSVIVFSYDMNKCFM